MIKLLRWSLGWVCFCVQGSQARRFVYECICRGIRLWDITSDGGCYLCCVRADRYRACAALSRQFGVKLRIRKKNGLPFLRRRYRKRVGLLVGACGFLALLVLLSGYVWRIDVIGNQRITRQQILDALAQQGVCVGMPKSQLDVYDAANRLFLELDELSWVFVNRKGTTLYVELRERVAKPEMFSPYDPTNVVASHTAQILRVDTYYGQAMVKPGDVVTQGQLLVSGVWTDREGDWRMVHADAHVWAAARDVRQLRVEFRQQQTVAQAEPSVRYSLELFGFRIPLYFKEGEGEDLRQTFTPLTLFGTELPIGLHKTEYRHVVTQTVVLSQEQAQERALAQLAAVENEAFAGCIIRQRETAVVADPDGLTVTAVYEVEMDIAQQQPISWQEPRA